MVYASATLSLLNPLSQVVVWLDFLSWLVCTVFRLQHAELIFILYHFLVWFWTSARQSQLFSRICVFIFPPPLGHCFLESCLFEAASLTGCGMVAKGFLPSTQFVLQKPCSSLRCTREFCCSCVWHLRLSCLSLFAVMLIVPFLVYKDFAQARYLLSDCKACVNDIFEREHEFS